MRAVWEADVLGAVTWGPVELAELVANDLGVPAQSVAELVGLYLETLDASLATGLPRLLVDQLDWLQTRLATIAPALVSADVVSAVQARMAPHLENAARSAVDRHLQEVARLAATEESLPHVPAPIDPRAEAYLGHLLRGDRQAAVDLVMREADLGTEVSELLLQVLQPAQIELGRLWERGRISVAQEHFSTAVTQLVMSLLYPSLFSGREGGPGVVAVSAGPEAHEVGLRVVTDLLEQAGWRTAYLGSGVPVLDIVDEVAARGAKVLAVSGTMARHVQHIRTIVAAVRSDPRTAQVKIVVGGRPFQLAPELVEVVGADGSATDAKEAVELCNRLVGAGHASR